MKRIIRVFPRRTSATPRDAMAFVGDPPLPAFMPEADEVHVSVAFTWDMAEAERLVRSWERFYPVVRIGGPALGDPGDEFVPGRYLKPGYTITSRGCPKSCPWCLVPVREKWQELYPIPAGHIVQDNNILACSEVHWGQVLAMLAGQRKAAKFAGGLQAELFTYQKAFELYSKVRVEELWFSYDRPDQWDETSRAIHTAIYWFGNGRATEVQRKVRCYVLAGYGGDTPQAAEARCKTVLRENALPFLMLWQPADTFIDYDKTEWKPLKKKWMRPAAMLARQ